MLDERKSDETDDDGRQGSEHDGSVTPQEEERGVTVEEESEQSFPASDPPSY